MFETKVLEEISRLQVRIAKIRRRYGPFCTQEVKDALGTIHTKIDAAADAVEAAIKENNGDGEEDDQRDEDNAVYHAEIDQQLRRSGY